VTFLPLETVAYRAPLAVQFHDSVTGATVADDLLVTAWRAGDPGGRRKPIRSPLSANMVFGSLPGSAPDETLLAPGSAPGSPPTPAIPFVIRALDPDGRYLPMLLAVDVPATALLTPPLFPAPTYPRPAGWAAVSGEVSVAALPASPATWAMVAVQAGPSTYSTVTDGQGRYVVYLPYPEALPPLTGSPPGGGGPFDQITWPLTVSVRYQPAAQRRLADAHPYDPPEQGSVLSQAAAAISSGGGTAAALATTLTFGVPLLLMLQVVPA
jgi:hypothetical protein